MKKNEAKNPKTLEDCGGLKPIVLIKPPKEASTKKTGTKAGTKKK